MKEYLKIFKLELTYQKINLMKQYKVGENIMLKLLKKITKL